MISARSHSVAGSSLIVTLSVLTGLSLMAAFTLARVMPRIRMAYQNAAWQEARVAAEAGIDVAVNGLIKNASGFNSGPWTGWEEEVIPPDPKGKAGPEGLIKKLATAPQDKVADILAKLAKKNKKKTATVGTVASSAPLYLDNLNVSSVSGLPTAVDIRLWALEPTAAPHTHWFRIRSMGTCALPPAAYEAPANLDSLLRRFSLRSVRASLKKDDAGKPTTIALPNVSRTVEALVEPILPFELAIWSGHALSLAPTGQWRVDSFDSSDDTRSDAGKYPGSSSPLVRANGSVATSEARPFDSLYGPLIAANGTVIRGAAATNGGDDPSTADHENVSGAVGIDPNRIRDDFSRKMAVLERPSIPDALPAPTTGSFVPGTETVPTIYWAAGNVNQLRVAAPPVGTTGSIVIMIDGDLDLAGPLILPPSVVALLYVKGNIAFHDNVNSGPWNSNRATNLLIFADSPGPMHQTVEAFGNSAVCAAFYGPMSDVALEGDVNWIGSIAASNLRIRSGGDGGIHYDEALATLGPPISFRISRYIEDVRE